MCHSINVLGIICGMDITYACGYKNWNICTICWIQNSNTMSFVAHWRRSTTKFPHRPWSSSESGISIMPMSRLWGRARINEPIRQIYQALAKYYLCTLHKTRDLLHTGPYGASPLIAIALNREKILIHEMEDLFLDRYQGILVIKLNFWVTRANLDSRFPV